MKVSDLIAALQSLDPATPVSHELLAELAPVDEVAVYGGGPAHFHPSIYQFRQQRYLRAATATKRAIKVLREAGWDARVTQKSIRQGTAFVQRIDFVVIPLAPGLEPDVTFEQQAAAEKLIKTEMAGWPYGVDSGCFILPEEHRKTFDAALGFDDIEDGTPPFVVFATGLVSKQVRDYIFSQGQPLFYEAQDIGEIVREWPDGRREIVKQDASGELVVVRELAPRPGKA